jgi:hypothetical protein
MVTGTQDIDTPRRARACGVCLKMFLVMPAGRPIPFFVW